MCRHVIVLTVALASAGAACAPLFFDYEVSAPLALPPGLAGKLDRTGEADLVFAGFKLKLAALDETLTGDTGLLLIPINNRFEPGPVPSLMLLFLFEATRPGLSFNPMEVGVELPLSGPTYPVSYVGPGTPSLHRVKYSHTERCCAGPKGFWRRPLDLPRQTVATSWTIPVGATCFVVAFDASVQGTRGATVRIQGIKDKEQPLAIPAIPFVRRPARTWARFNIRPPGLP